MKKITVLMTILAAVLVTTRTLSMQDGGLNMTGAPGEGDCTGCHTGTANPDALGQLNITIAGNPTGYEPGKTYDVTVTNTHNGKSTFGFGFAVRRQGVAWTSAGLLIGDTNGVVRSSDFATHTRASISGANQKSWSFKWKAPETNVGTVVMYLAGVVGNGNQSNTGDKVYTVSRTFPAATTGLKETGADMMSLKNTLVEQHLELGVNMATNGKVELRLFNMRGLLIRQLVSQEYTAGNHHWIFTRPEEALPGMYFLQIETPDGVQVSKLVFK